MSQHRENPFPGLRSFGPDDASFFFGRKQQIYELLRILSKQRFIAVLGSSGSGKSSLVKAGLIPNLSNHEYTRSNKEWLYTIVRPEGDPIGNLARGLNTDVLLQSDDYQEQYTEANLRLRSSGVIDSLRQARIKNKVLLVIDQFEELFRFKNISEKTREDAILFNRILLTSISQQELPVYVILTMRTEFLGRCIELPGLTDVINTSQFLMPIMTRENYRQAVVGPIHSMGAAIDQGAVANILNDIEDREDQLPIMQHALMRTWQEFQKRGAKDTTILPEDYNKTGGIQTALDQHANTVFESLPRAGLDLAAETVFKAVTVLGAENVGVRSPRQLGKVVSAVQLNYESPESAMKDVMAVLNAFRAAGVNMLMPPNPEELTESTVIDITHESLMRKWKRLQAWVVEEASAAGYYSRLTEQALLWKAGNGDLIIGREYDAAEKFMRTCGIGWSQRYNNDFHAVKEFVEASAKEAKRVAGLERKAANAKRNRWLAIIAIIVAVGGIALAWYAVDQQNLAIEQSERANEEAVRAMQAQKEAVQQREAANAAEVLALQSRQEAQDSAAIAQLERAKAVAESERAEAEASAARRATELAIAQSELATEKSQEAKAAQQVSDELRLQAIRREESYRVLAYALKLEATDPTKAARLMQEAKKLDVNEFTENAVEELLAKQTVYKSLFKVDFDVSALDVSASGLIAIGGTKGEITVRNMNGTEQWSTTMTGGVVWSIKWSNDNRLLGCTGQSIEAWSEQGAKLLTPRYGGKSPFGLVDWFQGTEYAAILNGNPIYRWTPHIKKKPFLELKAANVLAFSTDMYIEELPGYGAVLHRLGLENEDATIANLTTVEAATLSMNGNIPEWAVSFQDGHNVVRKYESAATAFYAPNVKGIGFTADHQYIITSTGIGEVKLWPVFRDPQWILDNFDFDQLTEAEKEKYGVE